MRKYDLLSFPVHAGDPSPLARPWARLARYSCSMRLRWLLPLLALLSLAGVL